jgi:hypothetical protein
MVIGSVLALSIMIFLSQFAAAQIGVDNDGPSFTEISIKEVDEVIYVTVGVRDLNGFSNIFSVNVTVYDEVGGVISRVNFSQYSSFNSSTYFPKFTQEEGQYLNSVYSTSTPVPIAPWNYENTETEIGLLVVFAFEKFAGNSITIVCTDMGAVPLSCEHAGPFSAEYTPPPKFGSVAIPISLSAIIAGGSAMFMVHRRLKNNQLARAVEATQRGK